MNKIEFQDYPSTKTPLNAENLNQLQDNIEEAIDVKSVYSTEETKIGTWVAGQTLYRKVVIFSNSINSNLTNEFPHNIENANLVMIKNAYIYRTSDGACYPLPITLYDSNTIEDKLSVKADRTNIKFNVGAGWGDTWWKIIILEYTKTTD